MNTLIIGATGTIGKEVTKLSIERGDTVIAASRKGNPSINIDNLESIADYFENSPPLDSIICVAGNASFGKFSDLNEEQINLGIRSKLLGQVNLVKKGIQKLKPGGVIILTGGMLAYTPWPETSNVAMVNAGLEGFVKAVALELDNEKRVVIVHPPLVRETAKAMGMDSNPWPSAQRVAETYISALTNKLNGNSIFVEGYAPY
jgi:NAD(P)-dependent dehydrogenase (short-subunit alcohol dehydrogenase family)